MAVDLGPMIDALNNLMPDEVLITRVTDAERVWNETTMQYDQPPAATVTLYRGKAMIGGVGPGAPTEEGRQDVYESTFQLRIPMGTGPTTDFLDGDIVTVTKASTHNRLFVGIEFQVKEEMHGSFAVSRNIMLRKKTPVWQ